MIENPYTTPITINQINHNVNESEFEKQKKTKLAVKNFIYGGIEVRTSINLKDKFKIFVGDKNEKHYEFTVDELLDDNLGFPVVCEIVVNKWSRYTHIKCPIKIKLISNSDNDNLQEFPYTVNIDMKSNILFGS